MERQYGFLLSYLTIFLVIGGLRSMPAVVVSPTFCEDIPEEFEINIENIGHGSQVSISFCNVEKNHNYYLISAKTGQLKLNFQTNDSHYIFFTNYEAQEMYVSIYPVADFMKFYLCDASINRTVKTIYVEKF